MNDADRNADDSDAILVALGDLGEKTLISESALAGIFSRHPQTIRRAVERGELPPPTKLLGKPVWTVAAILRHVEERLAVAAQERAEFDNKVTKLQA